MTLIQALRSNTFAIYIAIASVIVQSFHSFYAFYKISSLNGTGWGIAQAVLFAIIVDAAVLFYTVRKNTKVTWMAAFIMVLINLYVYWVHLGLTFDFALGVLIAFVIPVSNYFYSEEIEVDDPDSVTDFQLRNMVEKLDVEKRELSRISDKLNIRLKNTEADLNIEKEKSTKYITELREEIKWRDEQINELRIKIETPNHAIDAVRYAIGSMQSKGFASLKSPAQETPPIDKSLLGVDKIISTDRPIPE